MRWGFSPRRKVRKFDDTATDEDAIVLYVDGKPITQRELCIATAEGRRRLGIQPPECEHTNRSKRLQAGGIRLCLVCGEDVPDAVQ